MVKGSVSRSVSGNENRKRGPCAGSLFRAGPSLTDGFFQLVAVKSLVPFKRAEYALNVVAGFNEGDPVNAFDAAVPGLG